MASESSDRVSENFLKTPPSLKAPVWRYFGFRKEKDTDALDKTNAVCKLCQIEVKYFGNTTNLNKHLQRHHPGIKPSTGQTGQQMKLKESLTLPANSARSHSITMAIAEFVCKDMRPYSVVENEGFRRLMNVVEPHYAMVSLWWDKWKCYTLFTGSYVLIYVMFFCIYRLFMFLFTVSYVSCYIDWEVFFILINKNNAFGCNSFWVNSYCQIMHWLVSQLEVDWPLPF